MVEIISVHIPKTAGSTFRRVIGQTYKPEEIVDYAPNNDRDNNELNTIVQNSSNIKVIHGHFYGKLFDTLFPKARKIAWVRHPVMRLISHYYYLKSLPEATDLNIEAMSLVDFAEHNRNLISKYISNLDSFLFVGIQEFFEEDLKELKSILGWGKTHINNENQNKFTEYHKYCHDILSDLKVIEKITSLNLEDLNLYEHLLDIRAKRHNGLNTFNLLYVNWQKTKIELQQLSQDEIATEEDLNYCYRLLLGREPDKSGKQSWLDKIKQEQISLDTIVFRFLESEEFRKMYFDDSHQSQIKLNKDNFDEYVRYCYKLLIDCNSQNKSAIEKWRKLVAEQKINMILLVRESIKLSNYSIV